MNNFSQQKKKYQQRIRRFCRYLEKEESDWISKRSWFEDLNRFDLGDSFHAAVFTAQDSIPKDKFDFSSGILIYALINIEKKVGEDDQYLEAGLEIEKELDDAYLEEEHESLLGYLWWKTIYQKAFHAGQLTGEESLRLNMKKQEFGERIKRIESIST